MKFLIIAPASVISVWFKEIEKHFHGVLLSKVWHGNNQDASRDSNLASATLNNKHKDVTKYLDSLDEGDPNASRVVIITSYNSGSARALMKDGERAYVQGRIAPKQKRKVPAMSSIENEGDDDNDIIIDKNAVYTTPFTKKFRGIYCDEGHKIKNTMIGFHKFVEKLEGDFYFFLTAAPMLVGPGDLLGYLNWIWNPDWEYTGTLTHKERYGLEDTEEEETDIGAAALQSAPYHLDPTDYQSFLISGSSPVAAELVQHGGFEHSSPGFSLHRDPCGNGS